MDSNHSMERSCDSRQTDHGPAPFVAHMLSAAQKNRNFRTAFWTGCHLQMTLMEIPPCGEIGLEVHPDTDQFIRVERGRALIRIGPSKNEITFRRCLNAGDAVFVPSGAWHNILNTGNCPLKLSSIYAPPHHPHGTIHRTKADSERQEN